MGKSTEKICTGCGWSSLEPLGTNQQGEPYLACCPDSNYKEVKTQSSVVDFIWSQLPDEYTSSKHGFDVYQQAKAMHREEIIAAVDGFPIENRNLEGRDYYNETFKQ